MCTPFDAAALVYSAAPEVENERSGTAGGSVSCGKLQLDCETIKPGKMELLQSLVLAKIAVAVATDTLRTL